MGAARADLFVSLLRFEARGKSGNTRDDGDGGDLSPSGRRLRGKTGSGAKEASYDRVRGDWGRIKGMRSSRCAGGVVRFV